MVRGYALRGPPPGERGRQHSARFTRKGAKRTDSRQRCPQQAAGGATSPAGAFQDLTRGRLTL